uniref:Uncharacterized protein n=1 Tax=Ralstonia solanacearum TaxID=305 RepID=A0A0S4VJY0_RALSL|nr:protein of unknown function [Ralstonia solanacearum]
MHVLPDAGELVGAEPLVPEGPVAGLALEWRIAEPPVAVVIAHPRNRLNADVMAIGAPAILLRRDGEAPAHGVALHVQDHRQHPFGGVQHRRPEAPFPQRAAAARRGVEVARVAPTDGLQRARQAVCHLGRADQVHVVRHQRKGVDGEIVLARRHAQGIEVESVVLIGAEHRLPIVAALQHVNRGIDGTEARQAGHDNKTGRQSDIVTRSPQICPQFSSRKRLRKTCRCSATKTCGSLRIFAPGQIRSCLRGIPAVILIRRKCGTAHPRKTGAHHINETTLRERSWQLSVQPSLPPQPASSQRPFARSRMPRAATCPWSAATGWSACARST